MLLVRVCAGIALILVYGAVLGDVFTGKVVRVLDGDTVEILSDNKILQRVRLAGIDAPEKGQPFGTRAKQWLLALVVGGGSVEVDWYKRDKYRRLVGKLTATTGDINLAMVRSGFAWWFREYAGEQSPADRVLYEAAERQARAERAGLWADPAPMSPWDWRHRPEPPDGYAARCPCGSDDVCTGKRGGRFCVRPSGSKKYFPAEP